MRILGSTILRTLYVIKYPSLKSLQSVQCKPYVSLFIYFQNNAKKANNRVKTKITKVYNNKQIKIRTTHYYSDKTFLTSN